MELLFRMYNGSRADWEKTCPVPGCRKDNGHQKQFQMSHINRRHLNAGTAGSGGKWANGNVMPLLFNSS